MFTIVGHRDGDVVSTVAILALALYVTFFSLGAGPGIWLVASVFSLGARGKAMSMATTGNRALATLVSATFLSLKNALGDVGFFTTLQLCCGNVIFYSMASARDEGKSHWRRWLAYFETHRESRRKEIELPASRSRGDARGDHGVVL